MTTYQSTLDINQKLGRAPAPSPAGFTSTVKRMFATVAVPNTAALNDLLDFFTLPAGAKIVDAALFSDQLDTNGAPTITLDVGDADGAQTIYAASTVAKAGGVDRAPVNAVLDKQYLVDTQIQGKVHAAGTTKAAGNVKLIIYYVLDGLSVSHS